MLELFWKSKAKAKKNQKGFTLVELIVVVAILGILAVIGITRFAGLTENARLKADIATAASLASAAQVSVAEKGSAGEEQPTGLVNSGYLNSEPKPAQSEANKDATWTIGYGENGEVTVTATEQLYPAPDAK